MFRAVFKPTFTQSLFRRSFATAKTAPAVFGPTGKLASKLFEESKAAGNLSQVRTELQVFKKLYESSSNLRTLFLDPSLSLTQKSTILEKELPGLQIKSKQTVSAVIRMAESKNLNKLKQLVDDFSKLVEFELKEVHGIVTSAEPLAPAQLTRLEKALKAKIDPKETLIVTQQVDPSILGGLVVILDNQILDLSVSSQIRELDTAIRGQ